MLLPSAAGGYDSDTSSSQYGASTGTGTNRSFPHTRAQLLSIGEEIPVSSALVWRVAGFLEDEDEEGLKHLLRATFGPKLDVAQLEQTVLDLMHRHKDDIAGVPFVFLAPTRRPSSRAGLSRPGTPTGFSSAPSSPLGLGFRRPYTPGPLSNASNHSPSSSPVLAHAQAAATYAHAQFAASLPSSPLSSPRMLNAKANSFNPMNSNFAIPRPLSAAAGSYSRSESPDMWSHSSPLNRATSNLAIAAPLVPESIYSAQRSSLARRIDDPDSDEGEFDSFGHGPPVSYHSITVSDFDTHSQHHNSLSPDDQRLLNGGSGYDWYPGDDDEPADEDDTAEGMTPFDVLSSVFGSTLAPSELEDALATNGYDFERAMAWLVDRSAPLPPSQAPTRMQQTQMGSRVTLVSRGGGRFSTSPPPRQQQQPQRPNPGGNRVCRYFVAGECLRADCRFSHDLERALCRFWLRGTCAKQEACEFLHHLPKDVDMASLNAAMARVNVNPAMSPLAPLLAAVNGPPPVDDFPALGFTSSKSGGPSVNGAYASAYIDPSRTRFAAAVKKTPAIDPARREAMGSLAAESLHTRSAIVAPRPSPRIKLRPPSLLPTLPTGEAINSMYLAYRSRALKLGSARNACLSRAADAWRRGDGAAAKRFSREGQDLNGKMAGEMAEAASKLVKERVKFLEKAVRGRDSSWSDESGDRTARGKVCGAALGVCLGIASVSVEGGKLTPEERTEALVDLHGLHSGEATECLETFLYALEKEHFYGLAYVVVGEEKHTQDVTRGASHARLATGVREWVHRWGYPWSERDGVICVDPLTHA